MALAHVPDPDLFIRTGGEQRLSNFLLWQSAYAELFFSDRLWPEFDEAALDEAIAAFQRRERRFGTDFRAGRRQRTAQSAGSLSECSNNASSLRSSCWRSCCRRSSIRRTCPLPA